MGEGRELVDEMKVKDFLVWTTLFRPDQFTFSSCLCACASIASLPHGRQIHACLIQTNFRPNMIVVSSLVDMYSKCDCLKVGKWNLSSCIVEHKVFCIGTIWPWCRGSEMFDNMVKMGVKPDRTGPLLLFWSMHVASHSSLVQVGIFNAFLLIMAYFPTNNIIRKSRLYVLLSSIYGAIGKWELVEKVRHLMDKRQVKKEVDFSKKWGGTENVKDQQTTSFDRMSDSHTGGRIPEKINFNSQPIKQ
ncbi:hypothetical protein CXB51_034164 [Gossypium anomalum]|uniref:Pentatricopeptide repeat-containing protein n=1 Tax=Gossypium anomalum TaxID=47600 RepID=A0A8J6CJ10_9ROSI|nr:hypothetical protein CXB51_034164 [Gossypium anomalum]